MARGNYQSYSKDTGLELNWIMRSSGPRKLRSSVNEDQSPRSYIIDTGGQRLRRNRRHLGKVPTPTHHDTSGEDSQIPDINGEPTPKVVQVEDTNVAESSNTSPYTRDQNAIPEQRVSSGRLVRKPIRYRKDI